MKTVTASVTITEFDDGETLIEFIMKQARIGVTINSADPDDDGWHFVDLDGNTDFDYRIGSLTWTKLTDLLLPFADTPPQIDPQE